jgi:hypothetical protein
MKENRREGGGLKEELRKRQFTCGDLNTRGLKILGVTRCATLPLPELLQIFFLHSTSCYQYHQKHAMKPHSALIPVQQNHTILYVRDDPSNHQYLIAPASVVSADTEEIADKHMGESMLLSVGKTQYTTTPLF